MRYLVIVSALCLCFFNASTQNPDWVRLIHGAKPSPFLIRSSFTESQGAVYSGGIYDKNIYNNDFNVSDTNANGFFLVKYDPNGVFQWVRTFNSVARFLTDNDGNTTVLKKNGSLEHFNSSGASTGSFNLALQGIPWGLDKNKSGFVISSFQSLPNNRYKSWLTMLTHNGTVKWQKQFDFAVGLPVLTIENEVIVTAEYDEQSTLNGDTINNHCYTGCFMTLSIDSLGNATKKHSIENFYQGGHNFIALNEGHICNVTWKYGYGIRFNLENLIGDPLISDLWGDPSIVFPGGITEDPVNRNVYFTRNYRPVNTSNPVDSCDIINYSYDGSINYKLQYEGIEGKQLAVANNILYLTGITKSPSIFDSVFVSDSTMFIAKFSGLTAINGNRYPSIIVYPTPFMESFTVEGLNPMKLYRVFLLDISGREVCNYSFEGSNQHFFTADHVAPGLYVLKIIDDTGALISKRLIKN